MDQCYGNSVHMTPFSMQHQQNAGQQGYQASHHYQQLYQDYPENCYSSSAYHDVGYPGEQYGYHPTASVPYGTGIESYLDPKYAANPAAFASRLPYLPFHAAAAAAYGMYDYSFEPAFIRKRNERERQRVKCVNEGYARLREHLPEEYAEKRLSKVETLRGAILYIRQLQNLLGFDPEKRTKEKKPSNNEKSSEGSGEKNHSSSVTKKVDLTSISDNVHLSTNPTVKEIHQGKGENNTPSKILKSCEFANNLNSDSQQQDNVKHRENSSSVPNTQPVTMLKEFKSCLRDSTCSEFSSRAPSSSCLLEPQRAEKTKHSHSDEEYQDSSKRLSHCYYEDSMNEIKSNESQVNLNELHGLKEGLNGNQNQSTVHEKIYNACQMTGNSCSETIQNNINETASSRLWEGGNNKQSRKEDFRESCSEYYHQTQLQEGQNRRKPVYQHSRYYPYSRIDPGFGTHSSVEKWDRMVQIKTEIHTPPPCLGYEDFNYNNSQLYAFQHEGMSYNRYHGNSTSRQFEYTTQSGGQSDGFKSDTSPESNLGRSP